MPSSVFAIRLTLIVAVVIGCVALVSAPGPQFTTQDKAYYADPNLVNFVRPGLEIKVVSAEVAADGTIKARFKLTDPKGLPLDREGITTPGAVSVSLIAARIPKGQTQYTAYTTRTQTSPITKVTAVQAGPDAGGTFEKVGDGEYIYTFNTKAPADFDKSATHSIGAYGSRNLTEFDLGTQYSSNVFTFVPDGSKVAVTRDVVRTAACNKCHDQLSHHGGSRRGVELCVLCHTPQTTDPDTGNTVNFPVMIHKIHDGEDLPSVKAGGKYSIIGFNQTEVDFSTVAFPSDVRRCEVCHEQGKGAAQETAYLKPNRAACGACHDDVNFATGENHVNLPQVSDQQCSTCHQPQGELELDASIKGAHTIPAYADSRPGLAYELLKVDDGVAGKKPTVTFTLKDGSGNPIPLSDMTVAPSRLALVMAGPTTDFGYTSFGSDVTTPGAVSEDATQGTCGADGTCTYTFQHAIPADAKGTYAIGVEGRRGFSLLAGTKKEVDTEYGGINRVMYFSVDGSPVQPRRKVVDISKCNQCHSFLSMHGENRNRTEYCVFCHNPSMTDQARRPTARVAEDRNGPPQSVFFAYMIHRIHTGEKIKEQDPQAEFTVVGFGGSHNDFTEVRFPALSPTGEPGDRRNCGLCHVNGSEQLPLAGFRNQVTNPRGLLNPSGTMTAACLGCHVTVPAASHALANTTQQLGEACSICHGKDAEFSVSRVHAR